MHKILIAIAGFCTAVANPTLAQDGAWGARLDMGYQWLKEGCYLEVLDSCSHWLSDSQPFADRQAEILTLQGNVFRRVGQPKRAAKCHRAALDVRAAHFGPHSVEVARSCQNLFNTYWDLSDYKQAAAFAEQNLEIRRATLPDNDPGLVIPTMNLGDAIFQLGHLHDAQELFQNALEVQVLSSGYTSMNTAKLQARLADCLFAAGGYYQALDSLQIAWRYLAKSPDAAALDKSRCLSKLGDCLLEIGDFEKALQQNQIALDYYEDNDVERAGTLLSLGRLHGLKREPILASEYFKEVVLLCEELPTVSATLSKIYLDGLLQLGGSYLAIGEPAAAAFYIEKGIASIPDSPTYGELLTSARLKLGRCKLLLGEEQAAANHFRQALQWASFNGDPTKVFSANYYLGELAKSENEMAKALSFYGEALKAVYKEDAFPYEAIQAKAALALSHGALAQQTKSDGSWLAAKDIALEGIADLQALKWRLSDEQSEMEVQSAFFQLYTMAIAATLALKGANAAEEAYRLTEEYRGSLFVRFSNQAQASASEKSMELRQLRHKLAATKQKRSALPGSPTFPLQQVESKRLDSLILSLQQELSALEKSANPPASLMQPTIPSAVVRKGLSPNQTLLEYHWGEHELFAFVFTKDTFLVKSLPLPKQLDNEILRFFSSCNQNPEWLPDGQQVFLPQLSHQLYANLLAPLKPWLRPQLTIVPDAWLYYVPFDALVTVPPAQPDYYWEFQYLAKTYSIGYANAIFAYHNARRPSLFSGNMLTAVAPKFEQDGRQLTPLFNNEKEAALAKGIMGGELLQRDLATKTAVLPTLQNSQVVLFSTHAILDDLRPVSSYLAFTEQPDTLDNENLYAWEIYNLDFRADLVVLSACQTANGQLYRGEGLMSMARAFQFAGAKTVVASLWNVDDKQTPVLMEAYFSNLATGAPKVRALSDAKKHYLENAPRLKTHPFFWSGFVSVGDDSPLGERRRKMPPWVFFGGLSLLGFGTLLWLKPRLIRYLKRP